MICAVRSGRTNAFHDGAVGCALVVDDPIHFEKCMSHGVTLAENRTMDIRDFLSNIDWNSRGNNVQTLAERLEKEHRYGEHLVNCGLNYGEDTKLNYFATGEESDNEDAAGNVKYRLSDG